MNRDDPALNASRRSIAVAIWSLLLILVALTPSEISSPMAIVVLFGASIASGLGLLLLLVGSSDNSQVSYGRRRTTVAISFAVPLVWSLSIGFRTNSLTGLLFVIVAVFPVAVMWFAWSVRISTTNEIETVHGSEVQPMPVSSGVESATDVNEEVGDPITEAKFEYSQEISVDSLSMESADLMPAGVTQWLTRSLTSDGEVIEGGIRIEFADGQRDATVHLSFCPPLSSVPQVTTEDLDGCDLEIRVSAAFPFGARITVRRLPTSLSEGKRIKPQTCRIGFVAFATAVRRAA